MQRYIYLLALFTFCFTTLISNAQDKSFDPKTIEIETFNDQSFTNKSTFLAEDGNTYKIKNTEISKGLYVKKEERWVRHGVWYGLTENRISRKDFYDYGKRDGLCESYHANGEILFQYTYINGLKEGKTYQFRDDGTMVSEAPYLEGKIEGQKIEYRRDGSISFRKNYVNGRLQGEYLQYNTKGEIVGRSQYDQGIKVGQTEWVN